MTERARLEEAGGQVVLRPRGGGEFPLPGEAGRRIWAAWIHMQTHGEETAETYLLGVGHGLLSSVEDSLAKLASRGRGA